MSFLSAEPQTRVVLENHSNILLAQFDTQLEIVANRYLAFFQERRGIEQTYIDSLRKLHNRAKNLDASLDLRAEPTTTQAAWDTVRDDLNREADSRQAFVDNLEYDVIKPLTRLKESNDETRKRIEEDLRGSAAQYADYAEGTLSRFQHEYLEKYYPQQHTRSTYVAPYERFGGQVSTTLRGQWENVQNLEPAVSEEEFENDCRDAVFWLNDYRLNRVEHLKDGYDYLEQLVFTTTVKDALVKYMDGMAIACAKYDSLAKSTKAEVKKALAGIDKADLKASFRRALAFSIPPLTLYRNYRPSAYSNLVFGVPLVDVTTNEDNVPKVMRMCIKKVEKRGLNTHEIYSSSCWPAEVFQLQHRFEKDKSFSFSSTDNIKFVALLLKLFLAHLPEPLFILSLQDYRQYGQNRARYTEDRFSLLRSKIRELNWVQRATLGALLRHLFRVASHSDKNGMTLGVLAAQFTTFVLPGNDVLQDGVSVKKLVMEDLIHNAYTLFDEHPPPSKPVTSRNVAETTSTFTYNSLFSSPELPQLAEVEAMGPTTRHGPGLFGGNLTPTQSSSSSLSMESRLTPPTTLLSPLQGFPSSKTPRGVETSTQEQVTPKGRSPKAVETLANSTPAEAMSVPSTSVDEWRLRVPPSRLSPHPEAPTIPRSPPESTLSSTSHFTRSSATSLQTGMGRFSP